MVCLIPSNPKNEIVQKTALILEGWGDSQIKCFTSSLTLNKM